MFVGRPLTAQAPFVSVSSLPSTCDESKRRHPSISRSIGQRTSARIAPQWGGQTPRATVAGRQGWETLPALGQGVFPTVMLREAKGSVVFSLFFISGRPANTGTQVTDKYWHLASYVLRVTSYGAVDLIMGGVFFL